MKKLVPIGLLAALGSWAPAAAQTSGSWSALAANEHRVVNDLVYHKANNWDARLDVYTPVAPGPHPTVLHIHGGGWIGGSRESVQLRLLPYLEMGFAVVNISYRLGQVAEAPAAVEDGRCALRWIVSNAREYSLDPNRIVVMGYSAGGHLALTTGLLSPAAGFDRACAGQQEPKPAAVVNWFGITDVADLIDGANSRTYAVRWLGSRPDRMELARRISPMTLVRKDVPPVLTIHGDADPTVPYQHATKFHAALQAAGASSELLTIPGGKHGNFPAPDQLRAIDAIRSFVTKHGILPRRSSNQP